MWRFVFLSRRHLAACFVGECVRCPHAPLHCCLHDNSSYLLINWQVIYICSLVADTHTHTHTHTRNLICHVTLQPPPADDTWDQQPHVHLSPWFFKSILTSIGGKCAWEDCRGSGQQRGRDICPPNKRFLFEKGVNISCSRTSCRFWWESRGGKAGQTRCFSSRMERKCRFLLAWVR